MKAKTKYALCYAMLILLLSERWSLGNPKAATDAAETPEVYKSLVATINSIEHIIRKRTPVGSSKAQVAAQLEASRKARKMRFQYLKGQELKRSKVILAGIELNGYDPASLGDVIYSVEDFALRGKRFRSGNVYLFSKEGKLIKAFVVELEGKPTLSEVKNMLQREALNGSSRLQVESWLKSKKIENWYLDGKESDLDSESDVWRSKYKAADLGGITRATIYGVGYTLPVVWDIRIVFFFGKDGKLKDYSVRQVGFGP